MFLLLKISLESIKAIAVVSSDLEQIYYEKYDHVLNFDQFNLNEMTFRGLTRKT